jgi:hypothetical protein
MNASRLLARARRRMRASHLGFPMAPGGCWSERSDCKRSAQEYDDPAGNNHPWFESG